MSVENIKKPTPADHPVLGTAIKIKRSILYDKTFMIDIVDKIVSSKVEKLINVYGGKILQSLEKNTDFLISDKIDRVKHKSDSETSNCRRDNEIKNVPCSKRSSSTDLLSKAKLLNTRILSAKQFQHMLKSLLKKHRVKKNPTDQVASVLKGKVSLKIESMDQGQCPVFEFIPKWPDLGDTLCKKKTKIPAQRHLSGNKSGDDYNSSDQYSTSEIGGMCELCDMPFMNYKEHINTKKHVRESQDENKFHELDELINERPLNVIFNQFVPEKKISKDENIALETSNCIENNTVITLLNSDNDADGSKFVPCSFGDDDSTILKNQSLTFLNRKCCSNANIKFVPQKRPSKPLKKKIKSHKNSKRKHKTRQKLASKVIYKVEVVNSQPLSLNNDKSAKPPVIIRFKRVQHSNTKSPSSDAESRVSISSDDDDKETHDDPIPVLRPIRVVRKPSFSNITKALPSRGFSENQILAFERPELYRVIPNDITYYPTNACASITESKFENVKMRVGNLDKCNIKFPLSYKKSMRVLFSMKTEDIGKWFYKIPKQIQDDLSLETTSLISLTELMN